MVEFYKTVSWGYGGIGKGNLEISFFETEKVARDYIIKDTWNSDYTLQKIMLDGAKITIEELEI